jgi:hypothetical protein
VLTYYKVSFPLWCLPTQWSDFEKYLELFKSVQKQFLSIVYYRELPIIVEYYEGIFYCIYLMGMTLILLYTEKVIWKKYRQFFEIN